MKAGDIYKISVKATGYAKTLDFELTVPDKIYAYANLSYNEYWANEGVYAAGNDSSSEEADAKGELDRGGYDAVSRATTNHGLHRGSFQQTAVIEATTADGQTVSMGVDHWSEDNTKFYDANGTEYTVDRTAKPMSISYKTRQGRETVTVTASFKDYKITGIKYVPVAVDAADYQDFCKKYTVVKNGQSVQGGYGEQNLKAYTGRCRCGCSDQRSQDGFQVWRCLYLQRTPDGHRLRSCWIRNRQTTALALPRKLRNTAATTASSCALT